MSYKAAPEPPAGTPVELLTEDQLLSLGHKAMARAAKLPAGTLGRAIAWCAYETYAQELERRAIEYAVSLGRTRP
jgi:hypothetical protein